MLTFVIPVAPYHEATVETAVASCLAQTLWCPVVVVYDHNRRGAGWARNRGLEQVNTPFVSFLDADDTITPDFAEKCLRAYDGRHYIYTDWIAAEYVEAPLTPWDGTGAAHIVTTLLPTVFVRCVGGFDENLPGMEDTDLGWKLTRSGLCGKRLPEALFHYGKGGLRAQAFRDRPDREQIAQSIIQRYEGKAMACCADEVIRDEFPPGEMQPGDVLADILLEGSRQHIGRATGRQYRRVGNTKRIYIDPRDIDAAPALFARVVEMPARVDEAGLQAFRQFAGQMREAFGGSAKDTTSRLREQDPAPAYAVPGEVKPDVGQVLRLYAKR